MAGVTLLDTAGYIDGLLVAKWFGGYAHQSVGEHAGSLQMHGNVYKGPLFCRASSTTLTTTAATTMPTTTMTTTATSTTTKLTTTQTTTTTTTTMVTTASP